MHLNDKIATYMCMKQCGGASDSAIYVEVRIFADTGMYVCLYMPRWIKCHTLEKFYTESEMQLGKRGRPSFTENSTFWKIYFNRYLKNMEMGFSFVVILSQTIFEITLL